LGTAALQAGRPDEAIRLFEQQATLAELADIERQTKSPQVQSPCKLSVTAYNNLAVAYLEKKDYLQARSWALVAAHCDAKDPATKFNLGRIESHLSGYRWPQTPAGEYVRYAGRATWQSFTVELSAPDSFHFCFSGLWWGLGEGPSGIGELSGTVPVRGNQAQYVSHEFTDKKCVISMRFEPDKLEVEQTGTDNECGFGHNVTASGTYQRISSTATCAEEEK
jgi:hypothetical protein